MKCIWFSGSSMKISTPLIHSMVMDSYLAQANKVDHKEYPDYSQAPNLSSSHWLFGSSVTISRFQLMQVISERTRVKMQQTIILSQASRSPPRVCIVLYWLDEKICKHPSLSELV